MKNINNKQVKILNYMNENGYFQIVSYDVFIKLLKMNNSLRNLKNELRQSIKNKI
jgi:hypothetical protein